MANFKGSKNGGNSGQPPKKGGFNPGARKHMGSEAYKGRMKKIKSDLIHKAKVKKEYAKVLKQEQDSTPEFYKKIFGERTIDDEGNVVAYKPEGADKSDDEGGDEGKEASENEDDFEVDLDASDEDSSDDEDDEESEDQQSSKKRKAKGGSKGGKKKGDEPQKKHKPNPFKAAIEKRERDMKAQQEEREAARRAKEDARKGREKYFAKRQKQSAKLRQKTERGQPKLGNHIQMLLGKIKQDVKKNESRVPSRRSGGKKKPQA
ncbi:hypothetical protein BGZ73_005210 [Actinomortierella ambigua]|nr:hypothetical protein BGZ73_005210 [Actinomortierella ambigua]